jgi:hypothetical protein
VLQLRRTPSQRFEHDDSIEHGTRIEQVLAEIKANDTASDPDPDDGTPDDAEA